MRVLIVKTSSMGDLIHTLPALTDAKAMYPDIQFDWVCEPSFEDIPYWHSAVTNVIVFPLRKWRKRLHRLFLEDDLEPYRKELQKYTYDCVIDAQGLMKSSFFITRFARGIKHGFDQKSAREGLSFLAYDITHRVERQSHAIARNRSLFAHSLGYIEPITVADASIDLGRSIEVADKLILITQSSRQSKAWVEQAWQEVIDVALLRFDEVVLPVGSDYEYEVVSSLCAGRPVRILHQSSLTNVALEIQSSRAVISVDTGLAHLADALGIPMLALYGPTAPNLVGPISRNSTVIKSPTKTLLDIRSIDVINWVRRLDKGFDASNQD